MTSHRCLATLLLCVLPFARGEKFPKPAAAQVFAEMKIYDAAGRPWRAAREDWAGAREHVTSDPAWAKWLKAERATVDAWMTTHHDRVEWACGWSHDFVSPKDGSRITWTPAIPSEQAKFLTSPSDLYVEITPKIMGGWVFGFRGRHADMMVRAARLYRLIGEARYADWAAAQLDFYAAHYREWPVARNGARLYWQTLDEASYGIKYTETARLLRDFAGPARLASWRKDFFDPIVRVLNASFQSIHNIATWQRCAVAQIALLYGDEAMWREALDGKFGLRRQMAEGITSDFLWWEQSLGYNNFVVQATLTLFTTSALYGRADELAAEMTVAEDLMLSPVYLRFSDGHLPNPADSTGRPTAPNRDIFAATYRVFPTPLGLESVAKRRDWDTLLDPPPATSAAVIVPEVTAHYLGSTQMALLRAGPWQVFVHYGQLTRSHAQAEALNFSASFGNTDVTHDTGTVGYGSPLHKNYYTRGANHNVPLVNGEGEETPPQTGVATDFSSDHISVEQPHYRRDARAVRTLSIADDRLVDTATIEGTAKSPQKLGLTLHLQGKARLPTEFKPEKNFAAGRPEPFGYWRSVSGATFRDRVEFDVDFDGVVLHVMLATPGEFRVWHGDTPDTPPMRRESFYVETMGTRAVFTTTFAPKK